MNILKKLIKWIKVEYKMRQLRKMDPYIYED